MPSDPLDGLDVAEVRHLPGCPNSTDRLGEEGSRIERYRVTRSDGSEVEVTRCCQCGEQHMEEVLADG